MRTIVLLVLMGCTATDEPVADSPVDEVQVVEPEPPAPPPALPVPTEPRYAASHVLVAWDGAAHAPAGVTRTEAEARALATTLHARAVAGEPIEEIARVHSDDPSAPRGGSLGVYLTGTMMPSFEAAIASVEPGAVAPLVRTPFGWHIARRDPVIEIEVAQILVAFDGAHRAAATRSRDEAAARVAEARAALQAGEAFDAVARRFSDSPEAARGGALGRIARGQMIPAFEAAAFALEPGAVSDVVETPYGLHLIHRIR